MDFTNIDKIKGALQSNTRVVYFESPVNPSMRILDIEQISSLVKDYCADIHVVIDNTYCTPALQRPLTMGADIVVHSATKYLGGHGDLIAGAVVGQAEMMEK